MRIIIIALALAYASCQDASTSVQDNRHELTVARTSTNGKLSAVIHKYKCPNSPYTALVLSTCDEIERANATQNIPTTRDPFCNPCR